MFQKYPMSLYMNGDVEAEHVIVQDEAQEAEMRAEGFRMGWESQEKAPEPVKRGPGRPRKEQA